MTRLLARLAILMTVAAAAVPAVAAPVPPPASSREPGSAVVLDGMASVEMFAAWTADLGHDYFRVRQAAESRLTRAGWAAVPSLRTAALLNPTLEGRTRAARLADRIVADRVREATGPADLPSIHTLGGPWWVMGPPPLAGQGAAVAGLAGAAGVCSTEFPWRYYYYTPRGRVSAWLLDLVASAYWRRAEAVIGHWEPTFFDETPETDPRDIEATRLLVADLVHAGVSPAMVRAFVDNMRECAHATHPEPYARRLALRVIFAALGVPFPMPGLPPGVDP